jgi:alanine racemase
VRALSRSMFMDAAPIPCSQELRYGVLPLGAFEGMDRIHSGIMLLRGQRVPVLGTASLEHVRVNVTLVPDARMGDEVVILGKQGSISISMSDVIKFNGHKDASYFTAGISSRIPRRYLS